MLVLYAVDSNALYQQFALMSLRSLREHSPKMKVRICVFGHMSATYVKHFTFLGAEIIHCGKAPALLSSGLKWFALREALSAKRVLIVDADTFFFEKVELLFQKYKQKDFYAHEEWATSRDFLRGKRLIRKRIKAAELKKIRREFRSSHRPVFNSSVMLFNHRSHLKIVSRLPQFMTLFMGFHQGTIPYPCTMPIITEEVCGSIVLGQKPTIACGRLRRMDVTHYNNWFYRSSKPPLGVLMHIGHGYMVQWLREFRSEEEANALLDYSKRKIKRISGFYQSL